jgi:uncharacterized repeat protein (TIGR03943 family)
VNRLLQAMVLLLVGLTSVRLFVTDEYLRFVKPSLGPWLLVVGVAVIVIAVAADGYGGDRQAADSSDGETAHVDGDGHGHAPGHGPRVGFLLFLPILTVFVVGPPALGAFSAERTGAREPARQSADEPLPDKDSDGYRRTTLEEYASRTYYNIRPSYDGEPVRLIGFALPRREGGWYLTRISIGCCAADGSPIKVYVRSGAQPPPRGGWVQVDGRGIGELSPELRGKALAEVVADRVTPVPEPPAPYE